MSTFKDFNEFLANWEVLKLEMPPIIRSAFSFEAYFRRKELLPIVRDEFHLPSEELDPTFAEIAVLHKVAANGDQVAQQALSAHPHCGEYFEAMRIAGNSINALPAWAFVKKAA